MEDSFATPSYSEKILNHLITESPEATEFLPAEIIDELKKVRSALMEAGLSIFDITAELFNNREKLYAVTDAQELIGNIKGILGDCS